MRVAGRGTVTASVIAWLVLTLLGGGALVRFDIAERRARFQDEARTVHRLLSQQSAQHEAILASLVTLDPGERGDGESSRGPGVDHALQRLPAVYPQLLSIQRRADPLAWLPEWPGHAPVAAQAGQAGEADQRGQGGRGGRALVTALAEAESRSRAMPISRRSAVMTDFDPVLGRYALVLAGTPASYALWIDARQLVTTGQWPGRGPSAAAIEASRPPRVEMRLATTGGLITLHDGSGATDPATGADLAAQPFGLTEGFRFDEPIDSPAQPFLLSLRRATGPAEWPWRLLLPWALAAALLVAAVEAQRRARAAQRREAEIGRLSRIAQLNQLGELAAGIAHELNQPLAAVLSSTQAAQRLLPSDAAQSFEDDEALDTVRRAMGLAAGQARRAADVLGRFRRLVEQPGVGRVRERIDPLACVRQLVDLLSPELRREAISVQVGGEARDVRADPVALEQVLYNLIRNAIQALGGQTRTADRPRRITVQVSGSDSRVRLSVRDNGPGLSDDALARLFEPFYTTRDGGLGLGLALCESLARAQDGTIEAIAHPDGAEFVLVLPAFRADEPEERAGSAVRS